MKVDPRREPLDPQERILADALARQPAIEPPAMLDARVLAQARAALQAQAPARRHPRPWWLSATLGTAAAAVLAAGLAWQAGLFDIGYGSSVPVPRSRAPLAESAETRTAVDIDLRHRAAQPPSRSEAETLREESAAAALPSAPPPAPPAPAAATTPTPPIQQKSVPAPVAPPAPAPPAPSATAQEGVALDALQVSGSRMKLEAPDVLPHWREDASLAPDVWFERVRERLRRGDRPGAVQSLRLFQHMNPSHAVPDDLVRLLAG